jgi:tetratricopeptide (TPR) repeat protein
MLPFLNQYLFVYTFVSDHFQYLASLGIITLVSAAVANACARWPALRLATVPVLAVLVFLTFQQAHIYTDKVTLYTATLERNPTCWLAELNLGTIRCNAGDDARGMAHFERALAINPRSSDAHSNLGIRLVEQEHVEEGLAHLKRAVELLPASVPTRTDYANALVRAKRYDEAIAECQELVKMAPTSPSARGAFGAALATIKRYDLAKTQFLLALQYQPDNLEAREMLAIVESRLSGTP